jgi:hypothetical protein
MNPRRRLRSVSSILLALALLCAAAGTPAQTTIYKQVDLAGRVMFTDRPDSSLPAQSVTGPALEAPRPPVRAVLMTSQRSATINSNEAARRLAQAQLMRSEGADPLPGEQTQGSAAGVPNQRYWQRQEKLRVLVEHAQQRANEARLPLLAQR